MSDIGGFNVKNERRKAQRVKIPFKIKLRPATREKKPWRYVESKNISGGGMGVFLDKSLRPGEKMEAMVYFDEYHKPFEMLCKVNWCEERGERRFRIGLKFLKIKDRPEFTSFLCEKILELFGDHY